MLANPVADQIKASPAGSVKIDLSSLAKEPWDFQSNDIAWCLAQKQGLIGSEVGTGKTLLAIGMAAYLKEKLAERPEARDAPWRGMVVMMPKMAGLLPEQWEEELHDFAPQLLVVHGRGKDKANRVEAYGMPWDVLLLNYEAARNDIDVLVRIFAVNPPTVLYCDEASAFRNSTSKTARLVRAIQPFFDYKFAVTGTPIQINVEDLHGIGWSMGWTEVVGTRAWFIRQYCIQNQVEFWVQGNKRSKWVTVGFKNLDVLRASIEPWFIRRTLDEPEVARRVPTVQPFTFAIPMRPEQVRLYNTVKKGFLAKVKDGGIEVTYVNALAKFGHLAAIADGTQTYDQEMQDHSAKADWLLGQLRGPLAGEKVLVFSRFVRSVRPLERRLEEAGIGYKLFLGGSHQTQAERKESIRAFKHDDDIKVLIGTQALEMGLNLQVARVLVFFSGLSNPKRMEQILGRIKRAGGTHANVAAITLMSADTVEEGLHETAIERSGVADVFWDEESVLFEQLGPDRLMQLIRGYSP